MPGIDFKTIPSAVPLTVENVNRIADRAAELARAFASRIGNLNQQVADAEARFHAEADADISNTSHEDRSTARRLFKKRAADKLIAFRSNIVPSSKSSRDELLSQMAKLAEEARFLLSVCRSPAQMLGRVALGDNKRTQYQQQLTGAGPVELESAAALAVSSGDVALAAAVMTVIDRMPTKLRPFPVSAFAERMWGEQHRDVTGKLDGVVLAYNRATTADSEFVSGNRKPLANLSNALAGRALDAATGDDDTNPDGSVRRAAA